MSRQVDDAWIAARVAEGWTNRRIARAIGCRDETVTRSRRRSGIKPAPPYDRELAERLVRHGWSTERVAQTVGCSQRTIERIRHDLGLTRPPSPSPTPEQFVAAERLLDDGCSIAEAARTVGCGVKWLYARFPDRAWTPSQVGTYAAVRSRSAIAL